MTSNTAGPAKQHGAVLIVSLVFMLILTIVCGASMQSATLQERMAGNAKDVNVAFQSAEAALRAAEQQLDGITVGPFNGSNGLYLSCADPSDSRTSCDKPDWSQSTSQGWMVLNNAVPNVNRQPEYIIEELNVSDPGAPLVSDRPVQTLSFYRVIARGYGASDRSRVVLSTTYRRDDS
jgi:type IV pilus assembly protein PilX